MFDLLKYADNTAIITDDEHIITYRKLYYLQSKFYSMIEKNKLMLLVCTNTLPCIVAYLSCIEHGMPVLLEDNGISMESLYCLIKQFQPEYLFFPEKYLFLENSLCGEYYKIVCKTENYVLLKQKNHSTTEIRKDLALMLSTSGSVGSPKHVIISQENLLSNTEAIVEYLDIRSSDCTITSMQMSYSYGLSVINTYLYSGACIVITEKKVYSPAFWKLAIRYQITSFSGVPSVYQIFRRMNINRLDLSSVRVMTQAGGAMDKDLWNYMCQYANSQNISFFVMYGQTEATARISFLPPEMMRIKCGSIGRAIPGGRLSLINECGDIITAPYTEGEIVYEGRNVSMGYAVNRQDLSMVPRICDKLCTGDYGYFDSDGYWYVNGRKDRLVKIFGKRFNLDEIGEKLELRYHTPYFCLLNGERLKIQGKYYDDTLLEYASDITGVSRFLFEFEEMNIMKERKRTDL